MAEDRRVVVTGIGLLTPLGVGTEQTWQAAIEGRSGIATVASFDASKFPTRIAGEVKDFKPEEWLDAKEVRRNDRFIHFALARHSAASVVVPFAAQATARVVAFVHACCLAA